MGKRFKFRISRLIPSCRSKHPSFLRVPPHKLFNFHFSLRHHVSSAFISVGCGFTSRPTLSDDDFLWKQEDKWLVVAKVHDDSAPRRKIYNSSVSGFDDNRVVPLPPSQHLTCNRQKKRRLKKKKTTPRGLFSSDGYDERDIDEKETAALVSSSRSFSTDSSSEFGGDKKKKKKKKKKARRSGVSAVSSPVRLSMFEGMIPWRVEGKVRESFAVVKKSKNPYEDFRRSMMEMILEKQIFEKKDLEQLLHCFLSLNSSKHHEVIVEAFSDIWVALFCNTNSV